MDSEALATVRRELAPNGVLRAAVNTANALLVSNTSSGPPQGVSPSLAAHIANVLGVEVQYVLFSMPGPLAEAVEKDLWDIGLIGADPARAAKIQFTSAYVEIQSAYLVPSGSNLLSPADVDSNGIRVGTVEGAAFDLWLQRHIQHAELIRAADCNAALKLLCEGKVDALAGIRARLNEDATKLPGARVQESSFMAVEQAVGCPRGHSDVTHEFLHDCIEKAKASGTVASFIEKHGVVGRLTVAPASKLETPRLTTAIASPSKRSRVEDSKLRIAVLGCGAMGSIYAALLASGGHEVWAVDVWQAHIDAMRERGLRVQGASGDRTVRINATTDATDIRAGSCDLVIIATKASGVAGAAQTGTKLLKENGVALTIQNGLGAGDRISQHMDPKKVLLGVANNFGASMVGPGHADHKSMNMVKMGEMSCLGVTPRLQHVVSTWASCGFKTEATGDIHKTIWEKFICNCTYSGSCGMTGWTVGEVMDNPDSWSVALGCAQEAYAVARAAGIRLDFEDVETYVRKFGETVRGARPSLLQDLMAKRRSEIDAINGAMPVEAAKVGMTAPVNATVAALIRARESTF